MPPRRQASAASFTTSRPRGLFFTLCSVVRVGHRQKPSWCLAVSTSPFIPAAFTASTHWSQFSFFGSKIDSGSSPLPHSKSVNVLGLKCTKAYISMSNQSSCFCVGRTWAASLRNDTIERRLSSPRGDCIPLEYITAAGKTQRPTPVLWEEKSLFCAGSPPIFT